MIRPQLAWRLTTQCLLTLMLLSPLTRGYSQCTGIVKLVNLKKQKTNFYSPHYDAPNYSPVRYMRVDQAGSTQVYLSLTVLGDSARFDPAEVDSSLVKMKAVFARLAQRDSLKQALPQKSIPAPSDRIDAMAKTMDSVMTKLGMPTSLRDSLVQATAKESKGPMPMAYRGSSLTFSDGTKVAWPHQLASFKVVAGAGTWSSFIRLTDAQLAQLATGLLIEVSVYKHEQSFTKEQAEQIRQVVNCMREAK